MLLTKEDLGYSGFEKSINSSIWYSIDDSIGGSIRLSIWGSIGDHILSPIESCIWDSVYASISMRLQYATN